MVRPPRYLSDFTRFTTGVLGGAPVILSQTKNVILTYTRQETNIALWDAQFSMAMVHTLAAFIAMPLHGKPARAKLAADAANNLIIEARVSAANSEDNKFDTDAPWIIARGYAGALSAESRFITPFGPLISTSDISSVS